MDTGTILLIILVVVALGTIMLYNRLVRLRNEVDNGFSGIEVQLKRRANLIPSLVETVKGYASHERETLESVTQARQQLQDAESADALSDADGSMRSSFKQLFAVAEDYPQLQADGNFRQLMDELSDTEDKIAAARRYYNATVQAYNTRIQSFPDTLVASPFNFSEREMYRVQDDNDRLNIPVSFS